MVSGTPEILQKIGFSNLPMTINQEHLLNMERDTEHYLSNEMIKQLPELMKDPIAIITSSSEENKKASIVMILKAIVNGKPYIAPVYITSESRSYNARLDSNNIATVFRKGNAVSNMMENAVQKENAGEVGVYYWNKTEARNLYERAGVQFSGRSIQDGLIHSIFDAGSPVNVKYLEQTETKQFQRWFDNSQIVNEDGSHWRLGSIPNSFFIHRKMYEAEVAVKKHGTDTNSLRYFISKRNRGTIFRLASSK